ncbi:MAG: AAA family ATPase [Rhizobiales bacterium]|nr:AAA family ATPase [Hyphomicrobiales bacterium]
MILHHPTLLVFAGLPGTGKTAVSRELTRRLGATYIRIDTIEQNLRAAGIAIGETGYAIANAVAAENLKLGRIVIADCVNPVFASRQGWREVAARTSARIVEIELVCSDQSVHRRRVESRSPDIDGHVLPSWDDVTRCNYEPWNQKHLVLDSSTHSIDYLVECVETYVFGVSSQ